jgi:hypothetical protein
MIANLYFGISKKEEESSPGEGKEKKVYQHATSSP